MDDLTLVIPAKKEKESLPAVLNELKDYTKNISVILEENDTETIESISDFDCQIIYQKNKGYGDALIQGISSVKTKYFCIFNADGSFNPSELKKMYDIVTNYNYDLVFGSRYEKNAGSEDDTFITLIGNYFFSFICKILFKLNISDILYTYVLGNTSKTINLNLKQKDFTFCVELPIKAKINKLKIVSSACYERRRIGGKKKVNELHDGFLILIHILKLFLKFKRP